MGPKRKIVACRCLQLVIFVKLGGFTRTAVERVVHYSLGGLFSLWMSYGMSHSLLYQISAWLVFGQKQPKTGCHVAMCD